MGERNSAATVSPMLPSWALTSENLAGGGVSAESPRLTRESRPSEPLTTDDRPAYLVLRAPRGERSACARALRAGAADAFELTRIVLRREAGTWVARAEAVWPGYVLAEPTPFLAADDLAADDLAAVGALTTAESALVRRLGGAPHVIQASQGRIEAGRLVVDFGPLVGLEPLVMKIDRHRRLAWLGSEPGRSFAVGLEVTSKS